MIRINLAPDTGGRRHTVAFSSFKLSLPSLDVLTVGALACIVAVVALFGYITVLKRTQDRLQREIVAATHELAGLKARIGQLGRIKEQYIELQKRIEALQAIIKDQTRPIYMFDAFADMIPRDLWITGLEESASKLKLRGSAFSTTAVSDFMTNLRASGRFKEVDIVVSRQDFSKPPRLVTFEVTCEFAG